MCRLSQSIHGDLYRFKHTQGTWQPYHKVHSNALPLPLRYGHPLSHTSKLLVFILHLLTIQSSRYKIYYVPLYTTPPIVLLLVTIHLSSPWMNRVPQTMGVLLDQSSQITFSRNTDTTFNPQNSLPLQNCSLGFSF